MHTSFGDDGECKVSIAAHMVSKTWTNAALNGMSIENLHRIELAGFSPP
jgi:hypothetical protein